MSQPPITFYDHLSVDNYLRDRQVLKLDRDENGLFWILESSVIQKYDGRVVTERIPHNVANPKYFKCLTDNSILLVTQESEIYEVDKEANELNEVLPEIEDCPNCDLIDVNLIDETLFLYFIKEEKIVVYSTDERKNYELRDEFSFSQLDNLGNIFKVGDDYLILTRDEKVIVLNNGNEEEQTLSPFFREINAAVISNYISPGELLFSLPRRNGTYHFRDGKLEMIAEVEKLVFAKIDRKGELLLALSRSYLHSEVVQVSSDDSLLTWTALTDVNNTYTDAYVEDIADKILLSSHTGIFFVEMEHPGIKASHVSSVGTSSFGNVIMSFAQVPDGDIYYVKENKGIFKFGGSQYPVQLPASEELLNNLNCVYDAMDGNLWISGYTNQRQGVFYSFDYVNDVVSPHFFDRPIMYFHRLNQDEFLLSSSVTAESNIIKYNTKTKTITDTLLILEEERSRRFEIHSETELLIGTSKRLLLLDMQSETVTTILPETMVQSVVKLENGYGVCTKGRGLIFLNKNLEVIAKVDESNGLTNNQIYSLTEDKEGRFWVGTGKGLNVLDSMYNYIRSFRLYDGLSSYELNTNSSLMLESGNLLFGTINGVTEIKPEIALAAPESAVLSVPEISYLQDKDRVLQKVNGDDLNIPYDASDFIFSVKQSDFYKYTSIENPTSPRITSFPDDVEIEFRDNEIHIPKLNSDETKLNIYPANPLRASEKIEIKLFKRQSYKSLMWILGLLLMGSVLSYFITRRIIRFNRNNERIRRENEVRMAELELQALRSQMNPHFIFNSLGAILLYLQTNEKKKAEKYLTKFAKLMRMFLESSKAKFISFDQEKKLLELYLELEKLRFEDKFNYEFIIDPRVDKNTLTVPSMLLQPFVENSINHGLYHKKGGNGMLTIKAVPDGDLVKVIIRDNGVGRKRALQIRKDSIKEHRSRATEIIQERIQVLKEEKNIDIDIVYDDLQQPDGTSGGTEVIISIPKILKTND